MRLMPDQRLNFEKFGSSGLVEKTKPPSSTADSTATTASMPNMGSTVSSARPAPCTACSTITPGSCATRGSNPRPRRSTPVRPWYSIEPLSHTPATPAASIMNVPSSRERAICPSSRAFSRRLGEAASDFSRSLSSAMLDASFAARMRVVDCPPRF
ncbi:Uncharacterised protein [Bordetella pertussis]|nr:Uncharacterised protein [Bordetella pertussis]CPP74878.1 Uncharacterised protein [Bordetella pertussis]